MYQLNTQTVHDVTTVTLHRHHNDRFQQYTPSLKPTEVNWITFKNLIDSEHSVPEKKIFSTISNPLYCYVFLIYAFHKHKSV